jgi:beta-N-acetylhexosaminidase
MPKYTGGEFLVMGVPGETLDAKTIEVIKKVQPSGFILFSRNIKSPTQVRALIEELRSLVDHEPIIALDEEGGRVSRLAPLLKQRPVSPGQLRRHGDKALMRKHGSVTGRLVRLLGFNLNLAPVLDIELKEDAHLKDRTFGTTAREAADNAEQYVTSMRKQGILACGKHFPGYSAAEVDPHRALPSVAKELSHLKELEWIPFRALNRRLDLIMSAHVLYPLIDSTGKPSSLSATMVRKVLRDEWKFDGCIITDDVDMGAIRNAYGVKEASVMAFEAGNDLILVCHSLDAVEAVAEALAGVSQEIQDESYRRILNLRRKLKAPPAFSQVAFCRLEDEIETLHRKATATKTGK